MIEVRAGEGERPASGQEATRRKQGTELVLHQRGDDLGSDDMQGGAAEAAPEEIGHGDTQAAPDRLDLMIDVAEESSPVQASRLRLLLDSFRPVEGLEKALVLDHQRAVGKLRGQADDEGPEHVTAAWGVLVRHEVPVTRIDIEAVQLRGEGARVLRHEGAADLLEQARGLGVEVLDGEGATLGVELKGMTDAAVVAGAPPLAEGGRGAAPHQRLQELLLVEDPRGTQHRELGLVWEAEGQGLVGHQRSSAREGRVQAMDRVTELFQEGGAGLGHSGDSHGLHSLRKPGFQATILPSMPSVLSGAVAVPWAIAEACASVRAGHQHARPCPAYGS